MVKIKKSSIIFSCAQNNLKSYQFVWVWFSYNRKNDLFFSSCNSNFFAMSSCKIWKYLSKSSAIENSTSKFDFNWKKIC